MKSKIISFLLVFLVVGSFSLKAQQNTIFRVKAEGYYGWLLHYSEGNAIGGEVAMELPLLGNHNWEYTYNFPSVGFAVGLLNLDDPEYMRNSVHAVTYFHYPVVHTNAFALNLKWGSGLAGQIPMQGEEHDYFPLTGVLVGGLNMDIALSTHYGKPAAQWIITMGGNYMLLHNCNVTRKTKNTHLADVSLGLKYTPNVWPLPIKYPARSVKHILSLEAYATLGANQLEVADKYYPNGTLSVGAFMPISNAYRLGLTADGFYNGVYDGTQRTENIRYNFIEEDRLRNKIRAGISLANELTMDRAKVGLHVGVYCFDKIKVPKYNQNGEENYNLIENILYTKFVTRFFFTPKFFAVFEVKSHFWFHTVLEQKMRLLNVECASLGFGWAMPDFGNRIKNPFERISFKKEDKEELRITGSEK